MNDDVLVSQCIRVVLKEICCADVVANVYVVLLRCCLALDVLGVHLCFGIESAISVMECFTVEHCSAARLRFLLSVRLRFLCLDHASWFGCINDSLSLSESLSPSDVDPSDGGEAGELSL